MAKIYKDAAGYYAFGGGYLVRPDANKTSFKEGETVKAYHHGGSTDCSVSNSSVKEMWSTQSMGTHTYKILHKVLPQEIFDKMIIKMTKNTLRNPKGMGLGFFSQNVDVNELSLRVDITKKADDIYFSKYKNITEKQLTIMKNDLLKLVEEYL